MMLKTVRDLREFIRENGDKIQIANYTIELAGKGSILFKVDDKLYMEIPIWYKDETSLLDIVKDLMKVSGRVN